MSSRLLIPERQCIVVLDTAPARILAHADSIPDWVNTFEKMTTDGYSFSLADGAAAELLSQHHRGAISDQGYQQMVEWLTLFLNPNVPVLPGKMDISGMIGLYDQPWSAQEAEFISVIAWSYLLDRLHPERPQRETPEPLLEEERQEWIRYFKDVSQIVRETESSSDEILDLNDITAEVLRVIENKLDYGCNVTPPLSVRMHLQLRYRWRQFVRSEKRKEPYNPTSQKRRNDGIDADLYNYFLLPAFVITHDGGFFDSLRDIDSFQRGWFFTPEGLACQWLDGKRPTPQWPHQLK